MRGLEDYRKIVGDEIINGILRRVRKLYGKHILHVNSTYQVWRCRDPELPRTPDERHRT